ncbi:MAG: prolipoprotein diacylglyceryl transferase [Oscillospiraceae bacterium]|nr:prolipoprotein diacylglyceryl transferase [Oscillospiraceae bacterium]
MNPTPYYILSVTGAAVTLITAVIFTRLRRTISAADICFMLFYGLVGCLIGSKLLYFIICVDNAWLSELSFTENTDRLCTMIMSGGFIFYGGLAGALVGMIIYCKRFKLPVSESLNTAAPLLPLFHTFGRIGCFTAGCCHGIKYDGLLSVTYKSSPAAPNNIPLFPVQLFEAAGNAALFIILTVLLFRKNNRNLLALYFISYGTMRFILEFFRGDDIRGHFLFLSTSQWISIAAISTGIFLIAKNKREAS